MVHQVFVVGYFLVCCDLKENSTQLSLLESLVCLFAHLALHVFRWLHEVKCQSYSRFHDQPLKEIPDRFG